MSFAAVALEGMPDRRPTWRGLLLESEDEEEPYLRQEVDAFSMDEAMDWVERQLEGWPAPNLWGVVQEIKYDHEGQERTDVSRQVRRYQKIDGQYRWE